MEGDRSRMDSDRLDQMGLVLTGTLCFVLIRFYFFNTRKHSWVWMSSVYRVSLVLCLVRDICRPMMILMVK